MHSIIYQIEGRTLKQYRLSPLDILAFGAMCLSYALFTYACMST